jgi:hypothetical protein
MSSPPLIDALLEIINTSAKTMQHELSVSGLTEPWLSKQQPHPWDIDVPPVPYWNARKDLLAAVGMLTVRISQG